MSFSSPPPTKKIKQSVEDSNFETSATSNANPSFLSPPQGCSSSPNENLNLSTCCPTTTTTKRFNIDEATPQRSQSNGRPLRELMLKEANYDVDNLSNTKKREDYLAWDDYFMAVSFLSAQRSKDPEDQQGACIVDEEKRIVGIGYNGFPRGCNDDCLPWSSHSPEGRELHTKHPFMCHAEINAILNKCSADVKDCTMYVATIPDNVAAKTIIQSGIKEIVYMRNPVDNASIKASRIMFKMAGVKLRKYKPRPISPLDFSALNNPSQTLPSNVESNENESEAMASKTNPNSNDSACALVHEQNELMIKEASYDPTAPGHIKKRNGYLSWDDYFTAVAYLSARRSKDPNTQVGACIVDSNKCIIGIGYNGFPRGCSDDVLPWARKAKSALHKKYHYVVHAEVNAILNKGSKDVKGSTLYVALFPCCECAKVIIQAGIQEVVFLSDVYHDSDTCGASRIMFEMSGVKTRQYIPHKLVIDIDFQ